MTDTIPKTADQGIGGGLVTAAGRISEKALYAFLALPALMGAGLGLGHAKLLSPTAQDLANIEKRIVIANQREALQRMIRVREAEKLRDESSKDVEKRERFLG